MFVETVDTGVCTLKGMSRQSIQRIKAMLLCIEYGILFVDGVCGFYTRNPDGLSRKSSIPDERNPIQKREKLRFC